MKLADKFKWMEGIFDSDTLVFSDYVSSLSELAIGVGLVTVGRGVTKASKHVAKDDVSR